MNTVMKIQNLVVNHKSQPAKSNPTTDGVNMMKIISGKWVGTQNAKHPNRDMIS